MFVLQIDADLKDSYINTKKFLDMSKFILAAESLMQYAAPPRPPSWPLAPSSPAPPAPLPLLVGVSSWGTRPLHLFRQLYIAAHIAPVQNALNRHLVQQWAVYKSCHVLVFSLWLRCVTLLCYMAVLQCVRM